MDIEYLKSLSQSDKSMTDSHSMPLSTKSVNREELEERKHHISEVIRMVMDKINIRCQLSLKQNVFLSY